MDRFKRIRRYYATYRFSLIVILVMFIGGLIISSFGKIESLYDLVKIIFALAICVAICVIIIVHTFDLFCQYRSMYKNVKKLDIDCWETKDIFVYKSSFVMFSSGRHAISKYSAIKLCCKEEDVNYVLYYVFDNDKAFINEKTIVKGYLNVELYSNTNLVKSLGSELDEIFSERKRKK